MKAEIVRNKETGEFFCVVGGRMLLSGKSSGAIKRVHDAADAINAGGLPEVKTRGTGDAREFDVCVGAFVMFTVPGPIKAYRLLDGLEAALPPVVEITRVEPIEAAAGALGYEMPEVPVPDSKWNVPSSPEPSMDGVGARGEYIPENGPQS